MIWNHSKFLKGRLTAASAMLEFQTQNSCFARSQHASSWTPAQSAAEPNSNHFHAKSQRSVFKGGAARGAGALRGPARRGRGFPRGAAGRPRRSPAPAPRGGGTGAAGSRGGGGGVPPRARRRSAARGGGGVWEGRGLAAARARGAGGQRAGGRGSAAASALPPSPRASPPGAGVRPGSACAATLAGRLPRRVTGRPVSGLAGRCRRPPEENGRAGSAPRAGGLVPARAAAGATRPCPVPALLPGSPRSCPPQPGR